MSTFVQRLADVLDRVATVLAVLALSVILVATLTQVLSRQLSGGMDSVVDLTSQYLMPILVLFGITLTERDGQQVRIVVLANRMPPAIQRLFKVIGYAVTIVVVALIVRATATSAADAYERGVLTSGEINAPLYTALSIPPIAFAILLVRLVARTMQELTKTPETAVS